MGKNPLSEAPAKPDPRQRFIVDQLADVVAEIAGLQKRQAALQAKLLKEMKARGVGKLKGEEFIVRRRVTERRLSELDTDALAAALENVGLKIDDFRVLRPEVQEWVVERIPELLPMAEDEIEADERDVANELAAIRLRSNGRMNQL